MKKGFAILMILTLLLSAAALPALAEEEGAGIDTVASATTQQGGRGGFGRQMPGQNGQNGQMPQMPGQNGQNGQMPGQNGQNGQMPQMPDQNGQSSQMPGQNGQSDRMPGRNGRHNRQGAGAQAGGKTRIDFDQLLKDQVISQDVYDAIMNYMKAHAPQGQTDGTAPEAGSEPPALPDGTAPEAGSEPPALPDGTAPEAGSEPPALPDGTAPEAGSEPPALPDGSMEEQLLKELLENQVITQEQYDLLMTKIAAPETAAEASPEAQDSGV